MDVDVMSKSIDLLKLLFQKYAVVLNLDHFI